jgi:hypothetical protein
MKELPDKSVDLIICDLPYGCLTTPKIGGQANTRLPENSSEEAIKKCDKIYNNCDINKSYYHDFKVLAVNKSNSDIGNTRRTYVITGNSKVDPLNATRTETLLNQKLYYDKGINLLCGDTFNYINPDKYHNKDFAELVIIENVSDANSGIIGGPKNNPKIKIRFNTQDIGISKDKDGKEVYTPVKDINGNIKMKYSYVGICDTSKTCGLNNNKSYPRVCLYDDMFDLKVLEFEPVLVNY